MKNLNSLVLIAAGARELAMMPGSGLGAAARLAGFVVIPAAILNVAKLVVLLVA